MGDIVSSVTDDWTMLTVPGFAQAYPRLRKGELHRVASIPRTRFNGKISPHRVFQAVHFPLEDIKRIKNAVPGATVNDVAITICGGALRKYLQSKDELPEESLAAAVAATKERPAPRF